ncbi:MAG: hypothetical protein R3Y39_07060 [Rikenellaceae bacterium]
MKKTITTLALALSLCCVAQAQSRAMGQSASKPSSDAKLISTTIDGDYEVSKWLVQEKGSNMNNEFSVKYQINLARLISTYDNNAQELQGLRAFVDGITEDDNKQVKRIEVTGYASPDGPIALNEKLAKDRAVDCSNYIQKNHDIKNCPCSANGVALKWSDAVEAISKSSIPSKAEVLEVIKSGDSQMDIETKLKSMESSWSYLRSNILPPMRCVMIEVVYTSWVEMITRTPLEPEVLEEVIVANNYFVFIDDNPSDIVIFENQNAPLDFEDAKCKFKFKDDRHRDKFKEKGRGPYGREKGKEKLKKGKKGKVHPRRRR